jgi:hypothetical protein
MALENLSVRRICLHEVYQRTDEGNVVAPTYSAGLLNLTPEALEAFRSRILAAFKSSGRCMEMSIRDFGAGSVAARGSHIVNVHDADFVSHSRAFADALATAQASRGIPGGLVVVFDGTLGYPNRPYFAVMKAELHDGFLKTGDLQAQFVSSLFLSPGTKLYKIGIFISGGIGPDPELPMGWQPIVYDSLMSATRREAAATYFHSTFLGLDVPEDSAQRVRQFFQKTREFIKAADIDQESRIDLHNSLYTYLKVDQRPTIQVQEFAHTYMPDALNDDYQAFMARERFPQGAIQKDLSEIAASLRLRRFRFPNRITLSGPPEVFNELVRFDSIKGAEGQTWTRVIIRAPLESQE